MSDKTKQSLLIILIVIVIGGTIGAVLSMTYSPMKNLRNNTIEQSSLKDTNIKQDKSNNINTNNTNTQKNNTENTNVPDVTTPQPEIINQNISPATTQFTEEVAKYSTTIYDKEENRIFNIQHAVGILNGAIIKAGEEFSFNGKIGAMGPAQGFKEATGFDGKGHHTKIYAGGICQISSTLYNTALVAGYQITERHPHSKRVYYVPKDKDATIMYGGADLKFINNSGNDIKIDASTDGHNVTIKFLK